MKWNDGFIMFYWRCSYILFELGIGWKVPFTWYPSNIAKQFYWRTTPMPFSQSQRNEPYACKLCLSPLLFCCWLWRGSSAERVVMHNEYRQCVRLAKRNAMFTSADACEQLELKYRTRWTTWRKGPQTQQQRWPHPESSPWRRNIPQTHDMSCAGCAQDEVDLGSSRTRKSG